MATKYKVLGEGSYGSVVTPNKPCVDTKFGSYDALVSKIFKSDAPATQEYMNHVKISKIDPNHEFSLPMHMFCKTADGGTNKLKKQIIFEHGGATLGSITSFSFETLFLNMFPLFIGLDTLAANGYVHADIKPDNILVDLKNIYRPMTIIDFGMMMDQSEFYSNIENVSHILHHPYLYYPPEFKVLYYTRIGKPSYGPHTYENYTKFCKKHIVPILKDVHNNDQWKILNSFLEREITALMSSEIIIHYDKLPGFIDVYSLGMSILEVFVKLRTKGKANLEKYQVFYTRFLMLIHKMTHFDVKRRFSAMQAFEEYIKLYDMLSEQMKKTLTHENQNKVRKAKNIKANYQPKPKTVKKPVRKS